MRIISGQSVQIDVYPQRESLIRSSLNEVRKRVSTISFERVIFPESNKHQCQKQCQKIPLNTQSEYSLTQLLHFFCDPFKNWLTSHTLPQFPPIQATFSSVCFHYGSIPLIKGIYFSHFKLFCFCFFGKSVARQCFNYAFISCKKKESFLACKHNL